MVAAEEITSYLDDMVSTMNPAIAADGDCSTSKTKPQHACNKPYAEVEDFSIDLVDLIATCQHHTQCFCSILPQEEKDKQECRFGYPPAGHNHHHLRTVSQAS